ncbi:hypothetical protein AVEN_21359-1 [Araneus ventricosus]|uniref:Uncharacterized protein n=1 Tax=Araneus ventricosus TaxID=182803 RepID=A0A4Y2QQF9_ARAVE|nr:hypothetical protein AVEN_21359-1 [Araneus ventricosus]
MRSKKQTERQLLLMESSLAYPRGKEEKSRNSKRGKNSKVEQTLGYLGVVKPVTPKEDVPLRGTDGEDGIGKLVIGGDAFAVESDGLEQVTAEATGFFWTDGSENDFFATET